MSPQDAPAITNACPSPALLVALSGPSSSGKTTLARLLRDILPGAYILHLDDFYKPDAEIPVNADGVQDWDSLDAIDVQALSAALVHIRTHGVPPPALVSKEDRNAIGNCNAAATVVDACRARVQRDSLARWAGRRIAIVDGFLLYSDEMASRGIRGQFDVKLFMRADYATVKKRRQARSGYVTLDSFWEDPPGYVDDVVWPNYVKDHSFLFKDGDVDGEMNDELCRRIGIEAMPTDAAEDMGRLLNWATRVIVDALGRTA